MSKGNNYNHKLPDINELRRLYFDEKMSSGDIARLCNVTVGAVLIKFRRYNVKRRSFREARELKANHINLTPQLIEFIDGMLLADGCVSYASKNKMSACYVHADTKPGYIDWLSKELREKYHLELIYDNSRSIRTKYYREFLEIRKRWYPNGIRRVPADIKLSPQVVLNWYIGDGTYTHRGHIKNGLGGRLVLCKILDGDGKILLSSLLQKMNIENTIQKQGIYIRVKSRHIFFNYIAKANHIPPCYRYKFPKEYL